MLFLYHDLPWLRHILYLVSFSQQIPWSHPVQASNLLYVTLKSDNFLQI